MANVNTFKIGDIVQLKSGGPKMTVNERTPGGNFRCAWFAGNKMETGVFAPEAITSYVEEKKAEK